MQSKRKMWLWAPVTLIGLALTTAFSFSVAGENDPSKDKVAVVNGTVITRAQFDREMVVAKRRFSRGGGPLDDSQLSRIKKDLLENLIDRELLYQESQKKGIKVDEAAIDERFKKQFADEAKLKNILRSMNLSEAGIRSQFMRGMAIRKLVDQEIAPKATVSEKEMKAYYDSNPRFFVQPEQVQASHILIKVDSKADKSQKAEARKELEEIQQRIEKGEDFSVLAKESSECPSSAKGGDLGYFGRGKMAKPFEEAAFALKPGQVSEIVETRYGYHLIKAMGKRPERTVPYKEAKARIEQRLKREKIQKEVDLYVTKLKEKAKVERLLTEVPK